MKIKLFSKDARLPEKRRKGDAGWDVYLPEDVVVKPKKTTIIDLGFGVKIPEGYAGLLAMRSSICAKGLIAKMPLIDSNYVGRIHFLVYNPTGYSFAFGKGDRICSLFVFPIFDEALDLVEELPATERGENWCGSSGE